MLDRQELEQLARAFERSRRILTVLGDETRQHLIMIMMQSGSCEGMRVDDIASRTHLSRPAVSHHLQIMKEAGLIRMRKEGTKNFYYFDEEAKALDQMIQTMIRARDIVRRLPDRSEKLEDRREGNE